MASVNRVFLIGNVGKEPETRSTGSGDVVSFSLATSEKWKNGERTDWHNVVVFNDHLIEVIQKYVHKGSKLYVEGQIQTRAWTDKEGQKRYTTEIVLGKFRGAIVLLDRRDEAGEAHEPVQGGGDALDDEIPFGPEWR